jgi:hypothetical protein
MELHACVHRCFHANHAVWQVVSAMLPLPVSLLQLAQRHYITLHGTPKRQHLTASRSTELVGTAKNLQSKGLHITIQFVQGTLLAKLLVPTSTEASLLPSAQLQNNLPPNANNDDLNNERAGNKILSY